MTERIRKFTCTDDTPCSLCSYQMKKFPNEPRPGRCGFCNPVGGGGK